MRKPVVTFRIGPHAEKRLVSGRSAWTLLELVKAGKRGCVAADYPGVRLAAHIYNLKSEGLAIDTRHENHKGPFPGNHGRYVLACDVEIIDAEGLA